MSAGESNSVDQHSTGDHDVDQHNVEWDEAVLLSFQASTCLGSETLPLSKAIDRVLSQDLIAEHSLPPAHTAMMDGYAVYGPGPWKIVGELHAGSFLPYLEAGCALKVSTGAHLPPHCSFVIPQELATLFDGDVASKNSFTPGQHIRPPGDEAEQGEVIAAAGNLVTPAVAGLATSSGIDQVAVQVRPKVSVIVTGDELVSSGEIGPGQIRDSLTIQVGTWANYLGAEIQSSENCRDSETDLTAAIKNSGSQIIITTGGTAHGENDHLRTALANLNADFVVNEIRMRPGHPTILAKLPSGQLVAGLPGNPLAALVSFLTVVAPAVRAMSGEQLPELNSTKLGKSFPADRTRVIPITFHDGVAIPTEYRGSAMLRGLANAKALAVIDAGENASGSKVRILPLPWRVN
jgi:molybdopterin molybdotransferase